MKNNIDDIHKRLLEEIEEIKDEFYEILGRIVEIPSEKGEATKEAPFGEYPKKALEEILSIGRSLGFQGEIINNAATYLQYGEGEEYIGVFGHLDIVPAGENWETDPFKLELKDKKFFGRGVLDNKGPIIANLFGLYILKKMNIIPKIPIRVVFGSDEESGSNDIPMYLEKENPPIFGYTPDCKYPVVYGERGVIRGIISTKFEMGSLERISKIEGDFNSSFIPDKMKVLLNNGIEKEFLGKKAPSNAPDLGDNVIIKFAEYILEQDSLNEELKKYMNWLVDSFVDYEGDKLGIGFEDEDSGKTQVSLTFIDKVDDKLDIEFSIRYPVTIEENQILDGLSKNLPNNSKINIIKKMSSTLFDKDDDRLKLLSRAYELATNLDGTPVTTTGATYARSVPNIVAFGPSFPGQKGIAHKENEYMDENDLLKNLEIYTLALYTLAVYY